MNNNLSKLTETINKAIFNIKLHFPISKITKNRAQQNSKQLALWFINHHSREIDLIKRQTIHYHIQVNGFLNRHCNLHIRYITRHDNKISYDKIVFILLSTTLPLPTKVSTTGTFTNNIIDQVYIKKLIVQYFQPDVDRLIKLYLY